MARTEGAHACASTKRQRCVCWRERERERARGGTRECEKGGERCTRAAIIGWHVGVGVRTYPKVVIMTTIVGRRPPRRYICCFASGVALSVGAQLKLSEL